MADLPPVGALWIGGSLTWLEQLCLKSFVDQGHPTILYTYGEVGGVPDGVEVRDGREVIDTDDFHTHARTGSVALFSDLFRFHMLARDPDIIYIDTDVYSVRPLPGGEAHVFGYEFRGGEQEKGQINGAVLRLPQDSPALQGLLEFTRDEYPVPDWLPPRHLGEIRRRAGVGDPMHVSQMPWGIWGPLAVTAFLQKTGEDAHARPTDVYYPVSFANRRVFAKRPMRALAHLTENTRCIHLWAPIKRLCARRHGGVPPEGSYLAGLLERHGIDATAAAVPDQADRSVVA